METLATFVLYLVAYGFLGWIAEVLYVFVKSQKLENRGFLTGPFLPIYGFGAIILVTLVLPFVKNPFLVFVASVVASSVLEYVTSILLEKIFHIKLWDYSAKPLNLHGRVCLENSLLFGMLGLLLIYVIHPALADLVAGIPPVPRIALASVLLAVLVIDAANSFASLAKVRPVLDRMRGSLDEVHAHIEASARKQAADANAKRSSYERLRTGSIGRLGRVFRQARSTKTNPVKATS